MLNLNNNAREKNETNDEFIHIFSSCKSKRKQVLVTKRPFILKKFSEYLKTQNGNNCYPTKERVQSEDCALKWKHIAVDCDLNSFKQIFMDLVCALFGVYWWG